MLRSLKKHLLTQSMEEIGAEKGHIGHSSLKAQDKGLFLVSFACLDMLAF